MLNSSTPIRRGSAVYGADIGVILLDCDPPRPVGDVGNARTFQSPVLYATATGATPTHVVEQAADGLVELFVDTATKLTRQGARAITTSCGFLAIHQRDLAERVNAFVATSALLQVPVVLRLLGPEAHVGVITANGTTLGRDHLAGAGITEEDEAKLCLIGLEQTKHFYPVIVEGAVDDLDVERAEAEIVTEATSALERDPAIRAFVLECANLPLYAAAINTATNLPVWDVRTLVNWIQLGFRPSGA